MKNRIQQLIARVNKRSGQSLVEYALIVALIAVVCIVALKAVGTNVNAKLQQVSDNVK